MNYRIKLLSILLFLVSIPIYAEINVPTPLFRSIDLISGKVKDESSSNKLFQYEYYVAGHNEVDGISVQLAKGDFRIGRVKIHKQWNESTQSFEPIAYFFYYPGYTEVFNASHHKTIYRYASKQRIEAVEHYLSDALYRKERIFWDSSYSHIVSRVLEDAEGRAHFCCQLAYNKKGQISKETLTGNLSGACEVPLIIQADGTPQNNGIESYSTVYEYSDDLLIREMADNGSFTLYSYDPKTKQCLSKIVRDQNRIISRQFYSYDPLGLLRRVVMDDGIGKSEQDLKGVTARKILSIQSCLQEAAFGQPSVTENKYWDLKAQKEVSVGKTEYTYSSKGHLIQQNVYDANGELDYSVQMDYDEKGHLIASRDSRGNTTEASKNPSQYRYNALGHCIVSIDADGNETEYARDPFGRVVKTSYPPVLNSEDQPIRYETLQTYDIRNNVILSQDANGHQTSTSYTIRNKPIEIRYPDGSSEAFVYFLDGSLKELRGKEGRRTTYERDAFGRVLRSDEYAENGEHLGSLLYTYHGAYLASITDGKTFTTTFQYDGAGRQIQVKHATKEGVKRREWTYDTKGEKSQAKEWFGPNEHDYVSKIQEKDSLQRTVATRLEDADGHTQKRIRAPDNKETVFTQTSKTSNTLNQCVRQEETVDANGLREIVTYDALSRIESVVAIDPFGMKIREKQIRYDGNGNKVLERNLVLFKGETLRSFAITWTYDTANHLASIQEGPGKRTHYQYDEKGRLEAVLKPDGKTLYYTYDAAGHLIHFVASDHSFDYRYHYDENHRLVQADDLLHQQSIRRSYNDFNEMTEEAFDNYATIRNQYDLAGRRTRLTLPDGSRIDYLYDGALLKSVQRSDAMHQKRYQHDYQYDAETGRLQQHLLIGDLGSVTYAYDALERPALIQSDWWSESIPVSGGFDSYHRLREMIIQDPLGQIQSFFNYTTDHQLASEEGYFNHQYEQDSLYNCLTADKNPWTVNDLNQVVKTDSAEYVYDLNGNLIEKKTEEGSTQYEYDALNRLTRITQDKMHAWSYVYDPFHRRVAQLSYQWNPEKEEWALDQTERFLYDGDKEIGQLDATGKIVQLRVLGLGKGAEIGAAIAIELQDHVYAPIHDHQGSVRCLIDVETKQVAEFYRYTAYGIEEIYNGTGQPLETTEVGNPWRFSSKRCHVATGLIFFGKRDYDPLLARWISPDPLLFCDTPNLYAFVRNDPLTLCDPYGLFSISSIWNAIVQKFFDFCYSIQEESDRLPRDIAAELHLPSTVTDAFERVGKKLFNNTILMLLGYECDQTATGVYGNGEISDKVRVTFINGMLTTQTTILENFELLSQSHGGVNIHYIFRPTEGWVRDICQGILIKIGFYLGFRSTYTYLLAHTWKKLIQEMGGVGGGGVIIHYAHSLGGTETDRARNLLSPEEQKMIRVITIGSSTLVRNEGFASVVNYVSPCDGVSSFFLEPFGHIRNYFDPNSNVISRGNFFSWPCFPCDHLMTGRTYQPVVIQLGEQFLMEFAPR